MSSSDSYAIAALNNSFVYLSRYVLPVMYVFANIGNLLNALVFARKSWRKNVCVFYFNICLIFNTCYINSTMLSIIFIGGFNINVQNSNAFLCKMFYYTAVIFSNFLPSVLILASIDRLLISSQNVDTRLYSSKRLAYFSISIATFFWSAFSLHVLIKVNIQEIYPSYFICYYDLSPSYLQFISYISIIFDCIFCLSVIVLCIFSFKNVRRIRAVPRQQRNQIRTMTKKDFQLLRCLFVYDIVFTMFTVPLSIIGVYQVATIDQIRTPLEQAILYFFSSFCLFLHHIPFCANFYIFMVVSKAFRSELKRMIFKIYGRDVAPIHEEENKQETIYMENLQ